MMPPRQPRAADWPVADSPAATETHAPDESTPDASPLPAIAPDADAPLREETILLERVSHIGRYQIVGTLGSGGFGKVYHAYDPQLRREVAIKVPHPNRKTRKRGEDEYLKEARNVAQLDHPHIVPVLDVGTTSDGQCYIVSKLIKGGTLAAKLERGRLPFPQAAEIVAAIAEG